MTLSAQPLMWEWFFILMQIKLSFFGCYQSHVNKTHFHKKGCALGLILKVRVFRTQKWPITFAICWTCFRWCCRIRLFFAKLLKVFAIFVDHDCRFLVFCINLFILLFFAYSAASAGKGKLKSSYLGSESFKRFSSFVLGKVSQLSYGTNAIQL